MSDGVLYSGDLKKVDQTQYYRVPHDKERLADGAYGGDGYWGGTARPAAKPIPEVFRLDPDQSTGIPCNWIKFWWALNPMLDREHFELLLDNHWMLCNGTGWPGRYNCLTGEKSDDPTNPYKPPAFHAALINGGATVKGLESGGKLWLETLTTNMTVPVDYNDKLAVKQWKETNKHKWYYATTVAPTSGNVTYTTFAGIDGNRQRLVIPILTTIPVYIQLRELDRLPPGFFPPEATWKPPV